MNNFIIRINQRKNHTSDAGWDQPFCIHLPLPVLTKKRTIFSHLNSSFI